MVNPYIRGNVPICTGPKVNVSNRRSIKSICMTMVAIEREHFGDYGEIIRPKVRTQLCQAELQRKRQFSKAISQTGQKKIKMGKRTQTLDRGTLPRKPASRSCPFTVDIETGVLRVMFNEAASVTV